MLYKCFTVSGNLCPGCDGFLAKKKQKNVEKICWELAEGQLGGNSLFKCSKLSLFSATVDCNHWH